MADQVKLYDISGSEAVPGHVPADQVEAAVTSGRFSLPKGQPVPVVSPDGQLGHVPPEQAAEAFKAGYKYATPKLQDETTYGTPGQMAVSALEGAAESMTGGASGAIEQAVGLGHGAAKRSKVNPWSHAAGEVGGIAGGLLLTKKTGIPTVPGLLGQAGEAAAARVGGGAMGMAAQGAVEGAGMAAEHAVNERMLGDPDMTAEAVVAHVGLGAALGGGLGLALSPVANKLASMLHDVRPPTAETLAPELAAAKQSARAESVKAAADDIGAPVIEMQLTDDRAVHHAQQALAKSPSPIGVAQDAKIQQGYQAASDAVRSSLIEEGVQPLTKVQTGEAIRDAIAQKIDQERAPIEGLYNELKTQFKDVPLAPEMSAEASKSIGAIEGVNLNGRFPEDTLARQVSEEVPQLETLEQLRAYKAKLSRATKSDPTLRHVAGATNEVLNDLEEQAITKFAQDSGFDATEVLSTRQAAKAGYRELIGKLEELGGKLGKRKIYGPQDFLNHLEDMGGEGLVDRLFSKKDSKFLGWFKEQFPEQAQQLANYHKAEIAMRATEGEFLRPKVALNAINKLSPEVREFLFTPEQLKKIQSADTYVSAFPREMNPSGTAKTMAWMEFLRHPTGAMGQMASDVLNQARLHLSSDQFRRFAALAKLKELSAKTLEAIDVTAAHVLEQGSHGALPKTAEPHVLLPKVRELGTNDRDQYTENVLKHTDNPDVLAERMAHATQDIAPHAPDTATSIAMTAARAAQFLQSKAPPHVKPGPFQHVLPTSQVDMAKYMRYVDTVERPIGALTRIKNHSLLPQDIEALHAVHPKLYEHMRTTLMHQIVTQAALPKPPKLSLQTQQSLSLFLAMPINSLLKPDGIQFLHSAVSMPPQAHQQGIQQGRAARKLSEGGAKRLVGLSATPAQARALGR